MSCPFCEYYSPLLSIKDTNVAHLFPRRGPVTLWQVHHQVKRRKMLRCVDIWKASQSPHTQIHYCKMKLKCKSVWRLIRLNKYLLAMTMRDVNKTKTSKFCAHKTFSDICFLKINSCRFISLVKTFRLQLGRFISHWILFSTLSFIEAFLEQTHNMSFELWPFSHVADSRTWPSDCHHQPIRSRTGQLLGQSDEGKVLPAVNPISVTSSVLVMESEEIVKTVETVENVKFYIINYHFILRSGNIFSSNVIIHSETK